MKRIQVRPGKFVVISAEMEAKAAEVLTNGGITRNEALRIATAEPRGATVFAGPVKPSRRRRKR